MSYQYFGREKEYTYTKIGRLIQLVCILCLENQNKVEVMVLIVGLVCQKLRVVVFLCFVILKRFLKPI